MVTKLPGVSRALRGRVLSFVEDPFLAGAAESHRYIEDGVILIDEDGSITAVGDAADLADQMPDAVDHYPDGLIMPGFIDAHVHFCQSQVIASYGAQLLDWLQNYTFVEEQKFADPSHAERVAQFFLDELLRSGTTSAAVYCTVHKASAEAFFAESHARNMLMIAGKVMMDRGAPGALLDHAQSSYDDSKDLIEKWHGTGRQHYAITPRFAITSTEVQLEMAGALMAEHRRVHMQTHLAENLAEIETVKALFPDAKSYTDVYARAGLLGPRSLFGHCVHLTQGERAQLSESRSVAVHCPTSNLFLGSGLFDLSEARARTHPLRIAMSTDVGGGTSYSMLQTMAEAYKVQQLRGLSLPAMEAFYMITLGNARSLGLQGQIGEVAPGKMADLVVLDSSATPAMAHRMERVNGDLAEELFVLMTLGDDRAVRASYVAGRRLHYVPE